MLLFVVCVLVSKLCVGYLRLLLLVCMCIYHVCSVVSLFVVVALRSTFCMYGLVCVAFLPPKVYHMWCEVVCDFCSYAYTCVVVVVCVVFVCICVELDVLFAAFAWGL